MQYPKPKRYQNEAYLDYVRSQPCCSCLKNAPSDPHHISWIDGTRGDGTADDTFCVPMCRICHTLEHGGNGMERLEIAKAMVRLLANYIKEVKDEGD